MGLQQQYGPTVIETAASSLDELEFLVAITSNQIDDVPKLIYSDWLEQKGDPRGAYLRECVHLCRNPLTPIHVREDFSYSWLQIVGIWHRAKIREMISEGLISGPQTEQVETIYLGTSRPTIHLLVTPSKEQDIPSGATKFGGLPDLPVSSEWPVFPGESNEVPLFFAQLRLSDFRLSVVSKLLPKNGLLSFFHSEKNSPVLLSPEESSFRRADQKYDPAWDRDIRYLHISRDLYPLPVGTIKLIEGLDLQFHTDALLFTKDFYDDHSAIDDYLTGLPPEFESGTPHHQILGHGITANSYPAPDLKPGIRRLATFGSDDETYLGDSAQPFWYCSEEDIIAGRFEKAGCYIG